MSNYKDYTMNALQERLLEFKALEDVAVKDLAKVRERLQSVYDEIDQRIKLLSELKEVKFKPKSTTCTFSRAWVGVCGATATTNGQCVDHQTNCSCGKLATRDCPTTLSALICGRPLCDDCNCKH